MHSPNNQRYILSPFLNKLAEKKQGLRLGATGAKSSLQKKSCPHDHGNLAGNNKNFIILKLK
jgi:hypothetical protein